jgi:DNA-binding PadR family transcriptional regulator
MELTPAELTVLGLIVEEPRHGYDLERVIEARGVRRWTDIGFSSIYYLLAKLERRQLIAADEGRPAAKARRVFHATAEGRRIAAEQALSFIEDARPVPHPMLVGLANLALLDGPRYVEALRARLTEVEQRLHAVDAAQRSQQAQATLPPAAREVFSYSLSLLEAERSWLAQRVQVHHD